VHFEKGDKNVYRGFSPSQVPCKSSIKVLGTCDQKTFFQKKDHILGTKA